MKTLATFVMLSTRLIYVSSFASFSQSHPYRHFGSSRLQMAASFWSPRMDCWRPDVQDVERISFGKPAKRKGTGSRGVPHRLNSEERLLYDMARTKGILVVAGSAWRSERRDAPLLNTYRSLCDAKGKVCIVLHKGNQGMDVVVVDLSPLRMPESFSEMATKCVEHVTSSMDIPPTAQLPSMNQFSNVNDVDLDNVEILKPFEDPWESRPIYQLPPCTVSWELERSEAKILCKTLAQLFQTADCTPRAASMKPAGVKPGKSRQHGGYGIG